MEAGPSNLPDCDENGTEALVDMAKNVMKKIVEFNKDFTEFIEAQRMLAKKLFNNVTRYNILTSGPPLEFPIVPREELLEELIATIHDQSSKIYRSLTKIKDKYDTLPLMNNTLQQQSDQVDWNPTTNFEIKGTIKYKQPSEYLEAICDMLYQYDIVIACMLHYYYALNIHEKDSYENLMNSFSISRELSDFVNEFKINALLFKK
ncbi:unnamed protein product [Chironomus riparius]|uniref:Uncharacterized protein n=1 Tax=Chironomus riparius TaxID=315576 RepID=A0A9N9RRA3_9DIPT|nr:unnamed protein product [Chironomus riparius]